MFMDREELPILPQRIESVIHRPLEAIDIEIIFRDAGAWWLFYALLLYSGVRCDKLALLTYRNVERQRGLLVVPDGQSGRICQIPIVLDLLEQIPGDMPPDAPLFSTLYVDIEDRSIFEEELNNNLAEPRNYLQALLGAANRPLASLYSFTVTHRNLMQDDDLFDPDSLSFLAHIVRVILRTRRPVILN